MSHLLICGAAGYTNVGDDAILWGMLSHLREMIGPHPIRVAGGPELEGLIARFDALPVRYEDSAELARAIEDADLVLIGGGGLLYDAGYDATLARFLNDRTDRQWLYEMARVVAAAAAAARPVMLYAVGVGSLHTDGGRRVARYIAGQSAMVTVRDRGSAELLCECGVPRTRVHVAADPALLVEAEAESTLLGRIDTTSAPRPWIGLNLRPWSERRDTRELTDRATDFVHRIRERLGGTTVLLPFQRLYDDDRPVLAAVAQEAGDACVLADDLGSPASVAGAFSGLDLVVGMRLHSLVLALGVGVPFASLAYDEKVREFARASGLDAHLHDADISDPDALIASCEALLREREAVAPRLSERRAELRAAAQLPAEIAKELLAGGRPKRRLPAWREGASRRAADIRVLMQIRPDYLEVPGGDTTQMVQTKLHLEALGVSVDVSPEQSPDLNGYDLVHAFNLGRPEDPYHHCLNAVEQGTPVALSTVYWDFGEFWQWGDPDYWDLPDPADGLPTPRAAPLPDAIEVRRRAHLDRQRQAALEMATTYLPNGEGEADLLHDAYRMDLSRTAVVTNAVDDIFFEAQPDAFVKEHGTHDFVLCAARVEKRKNQLLLVAALRGTGIPLVIAGQSNPEEYRDLCRRYADDNVSFIGELSQETLASAYAAAKVHALAGWFETPGLSTLEAAAAGCNVVSTDRGTAREYFGDDAWYCDPRSIESIREAVLAAYEAPRSERLRERVCERHTWRRAAEQTLEAYRLTLSLCEEDSDSVRRERAVASLRRHADLLARLAADREYEARRMREWGEEVEDELQRIQDELERITSRRFHRLSAAAARAGWNILRALGARR